MKYVLITIPLSRNKATYAIGRMTATGDVTMIAKCPQREDAATMVKLLNLTQ